MVAGHGRRARIPRRSIAPERQANGADTGGPSAILVFSAVTALQPALPTHMARATNGPAIRPARQDRPRPCFRDQARRGGLGTIRSEQHGQGQQITPAAAESTEETGGETT